MLQNNGCREGNPRCFRGKAHQCQNLGRGLCRMGYPLPTVPWSRSVRQNPCITHSSPAADPHAHSRTAGKSGCKTESMGQRLAGCWDFGCQQNGIHAPCPWFTQQYPPTTPSSPNPWVAADGPRTCWQCTVFACASTNTPSQGPWNLCLSSR